MPLIFAPTGFHDWGLVTKWAQLLPTQHNERLKYYWYYLYFVEERLVKNIEHWLKCFTSSGIMSDDDLRNKCLEKACMRGKKTFHVIPEVKKITS